MRFFSSTSLAYSRFSKASTPPSTFRPCLAPLPPPPVLLSSPPLHCRDARCPYSALTNTWVAPTRNVWHYHRLLALKLHLAYNRNPTVQFAAIRSACLFFVSVPMARGAGQGREGQGRAGQRQSGAGQGLSFAQSQSEVTPARAIKVWLQF